jgi:hypothetical protein
MNRIQHAEAVARAAAKYAREAHKVARAMKALARAEAAAQGEKAYLDALSFGSRPVAHEPEPMAPIVARWVEEAHHVTTTPQAEAVRPRPSRPPMTAQAR